jgi:hypothetical protein
LDASSNRKEKIFARNNKTQKNKLRQDCEQARLRQDPKNPLRMDNSNRKEEDYLLSSLSSYTLLKSL